MKSKKQKEGARKLLSKCAGCGERKPLVQEVDWESKPDPFGERPEDLGATLCVDCHATAIAEAFTADAPKREAQAARRALVERDEGATPRRQALKSRSRRPSLSAEGNVPLTVRLIDEARAAGKGPKGARNAARKTLRKLYRAIGQTNKRFVRSRIRSYIKQATKVIEARE